MTPGVLSHHMTPGVVSHQLLCVLLTSTARMQAGEEEQHPQVPQMQDGEEDQHPQVSQMQAGEEEQHLQAPLMWDGEEEHPQALSKPSMDSHHKHSSNSHSGGLMV